MNDGIGVWLVYCILVALFVPGLIVWLHWVACLAIRKGKDLIDKYDAAFPPKEKKTS